jgi:hypothetical protein
VIRNFKNRNIGMKHGTHYATQDKTTIQERKKNKCSTAANQCVATTLICSCVEYFFLSRGEKNSFPTLLFSPSTVESDKNKHLLGFGRFRRFPLLSGVLVSAGEGEEAKSTGGYIVIA